MLKEMTPTKMEKTALRDNFGVFPLKYSTPKIEIDVL